ncbi:MAG: hypothetical protein WB588_07685 [Dehalococcoidia bacterium]
MILTIDLIIGILIAMAGVGSSLFSQGKALEATGEPDKQKHWGKMMVTLGKVWLGLSAVYLIASAIAIVVFVLTRVTRGG